MRCTMCRSREIDQDGFFHCLECLRLVSARYAAWWRWKDRHLCAECHCREKTTGYSRCTYCRRNLAIRQAKRRLALKREGRCTACASPLSLEEAGRATCTSCRAATRHRWARWKAEHEEDHSKDAYF